MGNRVRSFLLFCSGANEVILSKLNCAQEYNKYMAVGVCVLTTALLAFLSSSYAFYSVHPSRFLSLFFGLLWAIIIFNLDRFIVSTLRKRKVAQDAPTHKRLWQKLHISLCASPRLLLGVFISIIITMPIQLKLFEKEIDHQIEQTRTQAVFDMVNRINRDFLSIDQLKHEIGKLNEAIRAASERKQASSEAAHGELHGITGTLKPGSGPVHEMRRAELTRSEAEFHALYRRSKPIINHNKQLIASLTSERDSLVEQAKLSLQHSTGLLARLHALNALSERNQAVRWAHLLVILLFILLEITPILVHLLSRRGPYDDLLDSFSGGIEGSGAIARGVAAIESEEQLKSLSLGVSILEFVLSAKDQDHVIGDLLEEYSLLLSKHSSKSRAWLWFYRQVFDSVGSLLLKILRDRYRS